MVNRLLIALAVGAAGCAASPSSGPVDSGMHCSGDPAQACAQATFCPPTWADVLAAQCGPLQSCVGTCGGYGFAEWGYGDLGHIAYYDLDSGAVVALVSNGSSTGCTGRSDFSVPPEPCSCSPLPTCNPDGGSPDGGSGDAG